jgi:hypothetical protein
MLRRVYSSDISFACAVVAAVQLWIVVVILQVGIALAPDPTSVCVAGQTPSTADCVLSDESGTRAASLGS